MSATKCQTNLACDVYFFFFFSNEMKVSPLQTLPGQRRHMAPPRAPFLLLAQSTGRGVDCCSPVSPSNRKSLHQVCAAELWMSKNMPVACPGIESLTTTGAWLLSLVPLIQQDVWGKSHISHVYLMQYEYGVA